MFLNSHILGKTKRLKEAKEEAKAEIDGYKSERERQFREYQKEVCKGMFKWFLKKLAIVFYYWMIFSLKALKKVIFNGNF